MPFLTSRASRRSPAEVLGLSKGAFEAGSAGAIAQGLIGRCANTGCRSGWLHIFRKPSRPVFEGGWTCSPECTEARISSALQRELGGQSHVGGHRHRIPLGLLMLEKGWITQDQLRNAVDAQRRSGEGRIGEWLVRQQATEEVMVTRALGLQWSCPILWPDSSLHPALTTIVPRLFLEASGALPLRVVAGKILYFGFEESLNPVLALAVERMTGLRVESGIVQSSIFRPAFASLLKSEYPSVQLCQATSASTAIRLMARAVERNEPVESRLVRVHDCLWMRMILSHDRTGSNAISAVGDVVCTIGKF